MKCVTVYRRREGFIIRRACARKYNITESISPGAPAVSGAQRITPAAGYYCVPGWLHWKRSISLKLPLFTRFRQLRDLLWI